MIQTPSVLTVAPTPLMSSDALLLDATDRTGGSTSQKRIAAVFNAPSTTTSRSPSESESDPLQAYPSPHRARVPWTGAPMRAIIPLPRRALDGAQNATATFNAFASDRVAPGSSSHLHVWDDDDADTDSETEEDRDGEEDGSDVGDGDKDGVVPGARYCSYESITAADGLSAWSFEELRAECYAQSLIARGTKPPPVTQPLLAIPPAFVPRIIPQIS